MKLINSVTGQISISNLDCTLIHEHMRIRSEIVSNQFPHLYDEEIEFNNAVYQVNNAKKLGVKTIFGPTIVGLGRDVRFIERIALETEMQIVVGTGIYTDRYIPPHFQNRDIDYMVEQFVRDIEVGIQNTSIKAGFLKFSTDEPGVTTDIEKVIRAVGRAHKITDVPIMTHSHPGSENGLNQIELLIEEGVNPNRVLIGHTGDTDNIEYILKVLDTGAFVGMDRYGLDHLITPERRNATVIKLAELGYSNKMFLSQDYCCTNDWYPDGVIELVAPKWSMSYLLDEGIPELKKYGITEKQIEDMMVQNVKRWYGVCSQT